MKKFFIGLLALSMIALSTSVMAQGYRGGPPYGGPGHMFHNPPMHAPMPYHYRNGWVGPAIVGGVIGLGIGTMIVPAPQPMYIPQPNTCAYPPPYVSYPYSSVFCQCDTVYGCRWIAR